MQPMQPQQAAVQHAPVAALPTGYRGSVFTPSAGSPAGSQLTSATTAAASMLGLDEGSASAMQQMAAGAAMSYLRGGGLGKGFESSLGGGKERVASFTGSRLQMLRYYFDVSNCYVLAKLRVLLVRAGRGRQSRPARDRPNRPPLPPPPRPARPPRPAHPSPTPFPPPAHLPPTAAPPRTATAPRAPRIVPYPPHTRPKLPYRHLDWERKPAGGGLPLSPSHDVNAPDLYLPLMAYVTYILVAGFVSGADGRFTPEVLGLTASTGTIIVSTTSRQREPCRSAFAPCRRPARAPDSTAPAHTSPSRPPRPFLRRPPPLVGRPLYRVGPPRGYRPQARLLPATGSGRFGARARPHLVLRLQVPWRGARACVENDPWRIRGHRGNTIVRRQHRHVHGTHTAPMFRPGRILYRPRQPQHGIAR